MAACCMCLAPSHAGHSWPVATGGLSSMVLSFSISLGISAKLMSLTPLLSPSKLANEFVVIGKEVQKAAGG